MNQQIIDQPVGVRSAHALASSEAGFNLNQMVVAQTRLILQHAVRLVVPRRMVNSRMIPRQIEQMDQARPVLPRMRAPIRWLNQPGQTLVQTASNQYADDNSAMLPVLRSPRINEQYINEISSPDYSRGF